MPLPPGTRLGPYEIAAPLGAGGMGEVYRAHDVRLKREVAVKVLPAALADDGEALRRLEQEARAIAALNHPNLLTVYDVGTTPEGAPYLVCELLEGTTLRERLAQGPLPPRKAVELGTQIAQGLAAAHAKGIVHRDLKPDNIFCTDDGRVKILDFGLAKQQGPALGEDRTLAAGAGTAAGVVMGTVGYMSPEQARGQLTDQRTDIFSFGAVLYEMLSGHRAFRGDSAADVLSAILREEPPELASAAGAVIPPALERVVRHCLEKQPAQRFQSASDIPFTLADLSQPGSSTRVGVLAAPEAPFLRRRLRWAGLGSLGLAAAVAATWLLARRPTSLPHFQRITYAQGVILSARFLPDGQSALLAARFGQDPRVAPYTARFDGVGVQPLNQNVVRILAVSGGEAAVLASEHAIRAYAIVGTLARMPLSGGAPRAVLDNVQYADYAPGGDLAVVDYDAAHNAYRLEYPVGHVLASTSGWFSHPRFSRDGRRIAFLDHPILGDDAGSAAVVDLAGHKTTLTRSFASAQGLAWAPDDREIWFTASDSNRNALHAVDLGGHDRLLAETPDSLLLEDVARDGRALVLVHNQRFIANVVTAAHPQPLDVSVLDWPNSAALSADGRQILVGDESAGPHYSVFLRQADGSPPVRLGDGDAVDLSPDGQWALSLPPTPDQQLWLLPTGTGQPRQLTHSALHHFAAKWLPNGQGLLATAGLPGQPPRTYWIGLDGSEKPVTPPGIVGVVGTPDGRLVVAHAADPRTLYQLYPIAGGAPQPLPSVQPNDLPLRFAADGHSLYCASVDTAQIWRLSLTGGARSLMASVAPADTTGMRGLPRVFDMSADGKAYLYMYLRDPSTLFVVSGLR